MSVEEDLKQEIAYLSSECDRLRSQRDACKDEVDNYRSEIYDTVSAQLQLLSKRLSEEIREGFLSTIKRIGWILGVVAVVATAGGFLTISDLISGRIDEAVNERETDIARLREGVIQAVVDFKLEAAQALEDIALQKAKVAEHAGQARLEITSRVSAFSIGVGSPPSLQVRATAEAGASGAVWFGELSARLIGIAGSGSDQYGYEKSVGGEMRGAFSYYFIRYLADPLIDANNDGQISLAEAVMASGTALSAENFKQTPVIVGEGQSVSLFSVAPLREADRPQRTLRVVLIGINEYATAGSNLRGPVNDVKAFRNLLSDRSRLIAKNVQIRVLTDGEATLTGIKAAVEWLMTSDSADDISILYYSGHVSTIRNPDPAGEKDARTNRVKVLLPHDGDWKANRFLRVPQLARSLSKSKGQVVLVIDG
jgi:hypothetical protein